MLYSYGMASLSGTKCSGGEDEVFVDNKSQGIFSKLQRKVDASNIFYLDATGAVLSIFLLGILLPKVQNWHGMPINSLYGLCLWAGLCLTYNCCCILFADCSNHKWLLGIMSLNVTYCIITSLLVMHHFAELTSRGVGYFVAEIPVVLGLVLFERSIYKKAFVQSDVDR